MFPRKMTCLTVKTKTVIKHLFCLQTSLLSVDILVSRDGEITDYQLPGAEFCSICNVPLIDLDVEGKARAAS